MEKNRIYRTARQEAIRKGLIAKIFAQARALGMEKEDLYAAIGAAAKAKMIFLYAYNWKGKGEEKRVSLAGMRLWQLKQVLEAVFVPPGGGTPAVEISRGDAENAEESRFRQNAFSGTPAAENMDEHGQTRTKEELPADGGAKIIDFDDWNNPACGGTPSGEK